MAKKETGKYELKDLENGLRGLAKSSVLSQSPFAKVEDWISTGNHILNAQISGSIFKGIPTGRVTTFSGPTSTGKTFLALNCASQAQKQGYTVFWLDTEGALTLDGALKFGIDPEKLNHVSINTVEDTNTYIKNLLDLLLKAKDEGKEIPKIMLVLDSLGNLSTEKEMSDTASGSDKADMTRAKMIRKLFRVITADLAILQIPFIVINHTYEAVGSFISQTVMSGGGGILYNSSLTLQFTKAQLKESSGEKVGIIITSKITKSRFTKENIPAKFQIRFDRGMNPYCGLDAYFDWENIGIISGKYISDTECEAKESSQFFAVRHLKKNVRKNKIFTSEVFTEDVLKKLDEKIKPVFGFNSSIDDDDLSALINDNIENMESVSISPEIPEDDE